MDWGLIDRKPNFRFMVIETEVVDKHLCSKHEPPYVIEDLIEMELCRMKKENHNKQTLIFVY